MSSSSWTPPRPTRRPPPPLAPTSSTSTTCCRARRPYPARERCCGRRCTPPPATSSSTSTPTWSSSPPASSPDCSARSSRIRREDAPPTLQTLHWDLHKHPDFYGRFDGCGRVFFAGVSASQLARAPDNLRRQAVGHVPLATPLPALPDGVPHEPGEHLLTLGRFTRVKGYDTAARVCRDLGRPLVMAGPVAGWNSAEDLDAALAGDRATTMSFADVAHFVDDVRPLVDGDLIRWVGPIGGTAKDELLGTARAVLFPLRWEEPGGTAVVEALAAGVPVVALSRGVLPSLIDHGVTGFLADTEAEFAAYVGRVDELDRAACRKVAEERFSPAAMAGGYERLYAEVLARTAVTHAGVTRRRR